MVQDEPAQPARAWSLQVGFGGNGAEVQLGSYQGLCLGAGVEGTDVMDVKGGAAGFGKGLGLENRGHSEVRCFLADPGIAYLTLGHIVWSPSAEPGVGTQSWETLFSILHILYSSLGWVYFGQVPIRCDLTDESLTSQSAGIFQYK